MKSLVAVSVMFFIAMTSVDALSLRVVPCGDSPSEERNVVQMEQESQKAPSFCHGLDCPAFTVVNKTEDYELRDYEASRWVNTDASGLGYDQAHAAMFARLEGYIEGWNEKRQWLGMTSPIITKVVPGEGPTAASNFTMSFFLAPNAKDAPAPLDKHVYLSDLPSQRFFVSSFRGFMSEKSWIAQANKLAQNLEKDERKFDPSSYYTAGYDSPFRLFLRHNEIWFLAQE